MIFVILNFTYQTKKSTMFPIFAATMLPFLMKKSDEETFTPDMDETPTTPAEDTFTPDIDETPTTSAEDTCFPPKDVLPLAEFCPKSDEYHEFLSEPGDRYFESDGKKFPMCPVTNCGGHVQHFEETNDEESYYECWNCNFQPDIEYSEECGTMGDDFNLYAPYGGLKFYQFLNSEHIQKRSFNRLADFDKWFNENSGDYFPSPITEPIEFLTWCHEHGMKL